MDRVEAKWRLLRALVEYRRCGYGTLREKIGESRDFEVVGSSGNQYQIETQAFWDSEPGGDIRILGSIDDGGWRAICPLSYSVLIGPPKERH
jgi:hypothetical protein